MQDAVLEPKGGTLERSAFHPRAAASTFIGTCPVLRRDRRLLGDDIRCADLAGLDLQDCGARRIGCQVFPGNGNPVLVIYP